MKFTFKLLNCIAVMALMLFAVSSTKAQTEGSGIIVRVLVNGAATDYYSGICGYGTANWGGAFTDDMLCGAAAWGYDITPDSLGCDSIPAGQLTDKVAMIRRGTCGFSVKSFNAQQAGAVAVLIAQLENAPTTDDCFVQNMGATEPFATNTTVPVLFICRNMVNQIDAAIKAGDQVSVCFVKPDIVLSSVFFPASHAQTPLTQIPRDTFGFGVTLSNLSTAINRTNVTITAKVLDGMGNELYGTELVIPEVAAGVIDSFYQVPGTFVPDLPIGTYQIRYVSSADQVGGTASVEDRKGGNFLVTDNLFANENGATGGLRPGSLSDTWATGCVYTIDPQTLENYSCSTTEFTFATNAADYPVTDVVASIYLFKVNDDVSPDFSNFEDDGFFSSSLEWNGFGSYDANPAAVAYQMNQVAMEDINTGNIGVPLVAGGRYFVIVEYPNPLYNTFNGFNTTIDLPGVSTVVFNGGWFLGGFGPGDEAVARMYLDLQSKTDERPLPVTSMNIIPNPVVDALNLAVQFDEPTNATITIADMNGRVIKYENRKGLTNETLQYPLSVSAGTYLARIATEKGTLTKKFVVLK